MDLDDGVAGEKAAAPDVVVVVASARQSMLLPNFILLLFLLYCNRNYVIHEIVPTILATEEERPMHCKGSDVDVLWRNNRDNRRCGDDEKQ